MTEPNRAVRGLRPGSFEDFFQLQHDAVCRPLSVSLRDAGLAREATDEAFVRAFERWETVKDYDNPTGWVYRVALNWGRSRLRRRKFEVVGAVPERGAYRSGFDPDLDQALAKLPLDDRAMVVLKHLAGWTYEEIAEALGMKAGTVKSRLHRILSDLRTVLEVRS
ncbi:MAG: sigma-70 family RNA polymerase sigma factor [Acidimicrobiia bacterium]|nr:sigma-70 family RNA polymerase sigma factor [Acidimicrobiia bacterium]